MRYLFFPRDGLGSRTAREAESVWCAKHRDPAYNRAMRGQPVYPSTCVNPVAQDFYLGLKTGVQGTPTLVLSDGRILPGHPPAPQLLQAISQAYGVSS